MFDSGWKVLGWVAGTAAVAVGLAALFLTKPTTPLHGAPRFWFVALVALAIVGLAALLVIPAIALMVAWRKWRERRARRHGLAIGDSLSVGESLYSPDGDTRFTLEINGNMVVYVKDRKDICDTGTRGDPKCLRFEEDGWLTLYDVDDKPLWRRGPGGVRLDVQDNCHVVLYAANRDAIWGSSIFVKGGVLAAYIGPGSDLIASLETRGDSGPPR